MLRSIASTGSNLGQEGLGLRAQRLGTIVDAKELSSLTWLWAFCSQPIIPGVFCYPFTLEIGPGLQSPRTSGFYEMHHLALGLVAAGIHEGSQFEMHCNPSFSS
jgi:hypothetical protein